MKKFLFSVLAVGAIVACTKSEVKYEGESEIAFRPVASVATKANVMHAIDGTDYPAEETFKVYAYWKSDKVAGTDHSEFADAAKYIEGKEFAKAVDGALWRGAAKPYYWPKTGSMVFACFSPNTDPQVSNLEHDVVNDKFSFSYVSPNSGEKIDPSKTVDVMWTNTTASYSEATGKAGVPVTFKHALSWITFKVLGDNVTSNGKFVINSLTMNDVKIMADFTSDDMKWDVKNTIRQFPVFTGQRNLTTEAAVLENVSCGTLVVPQINNEENYKATIEFTNNLGDTVINEVVTVDLGKGWEIGKHYTYYITFTAKEILIEPHMEDWIEVDAADQFIF